MSGDAETVRAWRVRWEDVSDSEQLAWFQATRRGGGAPDHGQEVVAAEDYDVLVCRVAEAEKALAQIAEQQQKTLGWIRANGIVFDGPLGNNPKSWENVAFSIYSDLCEVDAIARAALSHQPEPAPVEVTVRLPDEFGDVVDKP